ncbi:MAG: hypothetical protein ACRDSH_13060 [Pseudonocardiaceae bacterium]
MAEQLDRFHRDDIAGPLMRYIAHEHETVPRLQRQADLDSVTALRDQTRKTDKNVAQLRERFKLARGALNAAKRRKVPDQAEIDRLTDEMTRLTDAMSARVNLRAQEIHETAKPTVNVAASHFAQLAKRRARSDDRYSALAAEKATTKDKDRLTQIKDEMDAIESEHYAQLPDFRNINSAEDYARHLIANNEVMKTNAWRMVYDGKGQFIKAEDEAGRAGAVAKVAQDQAAEIRHMLGIRDGQAPSEILPMLRRIADGHPPTAKDIAKIPDELRPPEVAAHTFIPDIGVKSRRDLTQKLAEGSTRYYDFFVGKPMARLWTLPLFQAELDQGYRLLEPFAEQLVEKGMSRDAAGQFLLHTSAKYATAKVFNTTDNVSERSMFAELADNWFMFARATENFMHRFGKAANVNPGQLARMWLLAEAAHTSGVVYSKPVDSEQGDKTELYFTYPGSAMMARFTNDIMRGLGFGDAGVQQPVFAGSESPVKWLNPSLTNPLGVTANPMFGTPLRIFRAFAPNAWKPNINQAIYALEGGEQFFASQSALKSVLPSAIYRLAEAIAPDEVARAESFVDGSYADPSGKLASTTMFAMRVAAGAGLLPGPEATAQQRQDAVRSMRITAHKSLVWRTLFGFFGPAVALQDGFETSGPKSLPTPNEVARKNGINSINNEFWQILNDASETYGSDVGFTMAMEEWTRRHPAGKLIYNPGAFTVGSSQLTGGVADDQKSIPRTMEMVQYFKDNPELHEQFATVLPYLLPAVGDGFFDSEANRMMYEMGLLERKDVGHFYDQVVNKNYIDEWWNMQNAHKAGLMNDDQWYEFDADWKQLYPQAAAEKDRRSDPQYVHNTLSIELKSFLEQDEMPPNLEPVRDQIQELYDDYAKYRSDFLTAAPKNRYFVNSDYREAGDSKWIGTPLNDLWKAFDVYEGNN